MSNLVLIEQDSDYGVGAGVSGEQEPLPDLIEREMLIRRILRPEYTRLVLISAPCGYGKTVLMTQARRRIAGAASSIWVSLSGKDMDAAQFAIAFLDAAEVAELDLGLAALRDALSSESGVSGALAAVSQLLKRLCRDGGPLFVFIDDFDQVQNASTNEFFGALLKDETIDVRFVVATRGVAVPGLTKLRLMGKCVEISVGDLQMKPEEVGGFFGEEVDDETAFAIIAKAEGWPLATGLAKLWRKEGVSGSEILARLSGENLYIEQYFEDEFFNALPEETQTFLIAASVVGVFDAEIADAVRNNNDSAKQIAYLKGVNGFLAPDNQRPGWFKHHRLFRDFLRVRLDRFFKADEIADMHRRASDCFRHLKEDTLALKHALAASDSARINQTLQAFASDIFWLMNDQAEFIDTMKFVSPPGSSDGLRLMLCKSFYLMKRGDVPGARDLLDRVRDRLREGPEAIDGHEQLENDLLLMQGTYNLYTDGDVYEVCPDKLLNLAKAGQYQSHMGRGVLFNQAGFIDTRHGNLVRAADMFARSRDSFELADAHYCTLFADVHLSNLALLDAKADAARSNIAEARKAYDKLSTPIATLESLIKMTEARFDYETGAVENAWTVMQASLRPFLSGGDYWWENVAQCYYVACMAARSCDNADTPLFLASEGLALARRKEFKHLERVLLALSLHISSINGDRTEADRALKAMENLGGESGSAPLPDHWEWRGGGEWLVWMFFVLGKLRYRIAFAGDLEEGGGADADHRETARLITLVKGSLEQRDGFEWLTLKLSAFEALLAYEAGTGEAASKMRDYLELAAPQKMYATLLQEGEIALKALATTASALRRTKTASPLAQAYIDYFMLADDYIPGVYEPPEDLPESKLVFLRALSAGKTRDALVDDLSLSRSTVDSQLKSVYQAMNCGTNGKLRSIAMYRKYFAHRDGQNMS